MNKAEPDLLGVLAMLHAVQSKKLRNGASAIHVKGAILDLARQGRWPPTDGDAEGLLVLLKHCIHAADEEAQTILRVQDFFAFGSERPIFAAEATAHAAQRQPASSFPSSTLSGSESTTTAAPLTAMPVTTAEEAASSYVPPATAAPPSPPASSFYESAVESFSTACAPEQAPASSLPTSAAALSDPKANQILQWLSFAAQTGTDVPWGDRSDSPSVVNAGDGVSSSAPPAPSAPASGAPAVGHQQPRWLSSLTKKERGELCRCVLSHLFKLKRAYDSERMHLQVRKYEQIHKAAYAFDWAFVALAFRELLAKAEQVPTIAARARQVREEFETLQFPPSSSSSE